MRTSTAGRRLAVQALYQLDMRGNAFLDELNGFLESSTDNADAREYAAELVRECAKRGDELAARIATVAEHWDVSRMAAVDRSILRVGAYELLYRPDVPPKVAVDEAIRLAKRFSSAESGAFVNGILDRIMAQCGEREGYRCG